MDIHKLSNSTAVGSFGLGTLVFLLFKFTGHDVFIGMLYIVGAVIFNSVVLLFLFFELTNETSDNGKCMVSVFSILANIPIAFIYFLLVISSPNPFY